MVRYECDVPECHAAVDFNEGFVIAQFNDGETKVWKFPKGCRLQELHNLLKYACCKEHLFLILKEVIS